MSSALGELPEAKQVRNGGEVNFRDPPWIQELDAMESGFGNKSKDAAIFMKLVMVRRKTGLPDEELQEMLRGKLRILENDSGEVMALFSELSARLLSIHSEEDIIVVTFKTFEEIWKFNTYYSLGLLGHCMENLLLDQVFWLHHLDEEDLGIEVLIHEETLHLMYKGILMQEESFFAVCTAEQNCESASTGSELRLQEGNVAIFEPPSDGSEWTVQLLVDGSRGSIAKPALEPVSPFHQWFLKACPENILMGNAKLLCEFPYQFAVGSCIATVGYEGSGPDELSFKSGDCVEIVGFLVSCFEWFVGKHSETGRTGLVKTSLVKPTNSICESAEVFLSEEEESLFKWKEEFFEEKSIDVLKKMCQTDVDAVYKLDKLDTQDPPGIPRQTSTFNNESDPQRQELQNKIAVCLSRLKEPHVPLKETQHEDRQSEHHHNHSLSSKEHSEPCFIINSEGDNHSADDFQTLLAFLNCSEYKEEFRNIYDFSFRFLQSMFQGYTDDEELVFYLGMARENARKKKFLWAQTRICFLLGKLCARRLKFSQARVYFEEALSVAREQFKDIFLLISIYTNLAAIYLKQKNKEKYVAIFERIAAFLMGIPNYICSTEQESEILKYVLKKAVLAQNKVAEVRTCFLLAKLYTKLNQPQSALLFTERLQILAKELSLTSKVMPSDYYLTLGKLYGAKYLPHLAVSSVKQAVFHTGATLTDCLIGTEFVMDNASRLYSLGKCGVLVPTQVAPYLNKALYFAADKKDQVLCQTISLCLSHLHQYHGMLNKAIWYIDTVISKNVWPSATHAANILIYLAWLHILNRQHHMALDILTSGLGSLSEHCTKLQKGLVYNMRAVALRYTEDIKQAAESYGKAIQICEESDFKYNRAIAQANFGFLCLHAKAKGLAELSLVRAVELFSQLEDVAHEENFITVLLELGQYYVSQTQLEKGMICYEWAFLMAIKANHVECQLQATKQLCHFYHMICPNEAQCIIYNEYMLTLVRKAGNKEWEGQILETISQLYFSLGTERAYKSALDYTKRSLGIFIDLRKKEKEAYAWLQAGKIYHILRQNELVDLYIQVAQDCCLSTADMHFVLELLEAAGDVFFNSSQDREKALTFYRDKALPIALKTGNVKTQLRLSNKLAELLLQLKLYGEAVDHAQAALAISISLGERLNERVAFHRLATLFHCLGQYEMAEHYYLKALSLCPSPLEFDEETMYYVKVYQLLGDMIFYDLKDPYDAAGYYHLALAAAMDLGNKKSQLKLCTRLATIYHNFLINRELSLFFYQKARVFAADLNVRRINLSPDQYYQSVSQYKTFV
ncbi:SH3 domain and tetratricopeptide repeat-containing protein 1 [Lepisosteus oculatus]|uniref:SH3 domain and tetratricopeptide repeat-containing protein 1 n=1 Tax=Lepisosteus oculatus TaxID=7918 RepID=UPI0035F516D5